MVPPSPARATRFVAFAGHVEALATCTAMATVLRWRGPAATLRLVDGIGARRSRRVWVVATGGDDVVVGRVVVAVGRCSRRMRLRSPCLVRSAAAQTMLARRGVAAALRIGVRPVDGGLEAHAWLEVDGRVVNDRPEVVDDFAVFDRPIGSPSATPVGSWA